MSEVLSRAFRERRWQAPAEADLVGTGFDVAGVSYGRIRGFALEMRRLVLLGQPFLLAPCSKARTRRGARGSDELKRQALELKDEA